MEPEFKAVGKTIGELQVRQKTGATIIALIEKGHAKTINPGPDQGIPAGATLVVAGERQQVRALRQLIMNGAGD